MTIEPICYVCGVEQPCIDGLCSECHMREFFNPGAAFAATFGSLPLGKAQIDKKVAENESEVIDNYPPDGKVDCATDLSDYLNSFDFEESQGNE